jgi:hypothetical protein
VLRGTAQVAEHLPSMCEALGSHRERGRETETGAEGGRKLRKK